MTKDPEYKNWDPEIVRQRREYKLKIAEIQAKYEDRIKWIKEHPQYHYLSDIGAPTLFPGEGSLTSDGLNSLQRAEVGEHPTEATLPMSDKKKKPSGIFTSVTTPKPKKQKKPKEGYTQTFQGQQKQATSPSCENCGNTLKPTAKFCGSCGTRID